MLNKSTPEEIEHAEVCLAAAKVNMAEGFLDVVFNRMYYAVFHAARALVVERGQDVKSHKGLHTTFSLLFFKTGVFPKEEARLYKELMDLRATADYGHFTDLSAEEAEAYLPRVEAFLDRVKAQLGTA